MGNPLAFLNTDSVMDDVADLEALFCGSDPLKKYEDEDDDTFLQETVDDDDCPSALMSPDQKAARRQMLKEACDRFKRSNLS